MNMNLFLRIKYINLNNFFNLFKFLDKVVSEL